MVISGTLTRGFDAACQGKLILTEQERRLTRPFQYGARLANVILYVRDMKVLYLCWIFGSVYLLTRPLKWSRLSEQQIHIAKWIACRG